MNETLNILVELLNEYRESECALDEDRLTWYATRLDKTSDLLYSTLKRLGRVEIELGELEQRISAIERQKATITVNESTKLDKLKCHLDSLDKIAAEYRFNIVALDRRISAIEHELSKRNE